MSEYITIPLSKTGKRAGIYEAIIDKKHADLASMDWVALITKSKHYAQRQVGTGTARRTISLHRTILERMLGRPLEKGEEVDHIDGNGLNNLEANLRLATHAQNLKNMKRCKRNTSGYKGVSWDKFRNKWKAQIMSDGVSIMIGRFESIEEAVIAYQKASDFYHKEFANNG